MLTLRKDSNDVFHVRHQVPSTKRTQSDKERKKKEKHGRRERSQETEERRKRTGRKLSEALWSPKQMLLRRKKPLGPSLSWEPERLDVVGSTEARSRIHSDGSDGSENERLKHGDCIEEPRFELEVDFRCILTHTIFLFLSLQLLCGHCALVAAHRRELLKTEIESAVKLLARRLGSGRTWQGTTKVPLQGMPNIVVSSISSDEDELTPERNTSSERGSSLQTSETRDLPHEIKCVIAIIAQLIMRNLAGFIKRIIGRADLFFLKFALAAPHFSSPCSSASASPQVQRCDNDIILVDSQSSQDQSPPRLLMPPALLSPYPDSASPPRSNSVDLSTLRRDIELLSISSGDSATESEFEPPTPAESVRTTRSKSHDPACPGSVLRRPSRIEYLSELFSSRKALAKSPVVRRTAVEQESRTVNKHRTSRYWLDEQPKNSLVNHVSTLELTLFQIHPSEHIWLPSSGPGSSTSVDSECYVGEKDCRKVGEKRRCAACHVVAHTSCFPLLSKLNLNCKMTFYDHTLKKQSQKEANDSLSMHHWVHKWRHEGRCTKCGKSFQQKMFNFQQKEKKETMAVACSWCKDSYHLKNCFTKEKLEERCDRGQLREMVVPPNWILRLPTRHRNKHKQNTNRQSKRPTRQFIVKPNDWSAGPSQPLLVFVNPKSGGNKEIRNQHHCRLEVYRKIITQLRLLVCGGDGTVGWVLQTLDNLNWPTYPPMAIMPLGTGNDLARCMGWGGVFSDEPMSQLLQAVLRETTVTHLDRWNVDVEPNESSPLDSTDELSDAVQSSLPLTVMNNYFSIGADAHVALQFHHSRSANPQMLNSRLKNRIAYGGLGTIDLFKRSWKDLSEYIYLECDGVDLTPRIKELKLHCILFQNITYYAGGTIPWGNDSIGDFVKPSCCDGLLEVLGFTTATLAALQMGGKGERLAQCSTVKVITLKPIPMQVDGEPCLLAPSHIRLNFHSKVPMLRREKKTNCTPNLMRRNTRNYHKDSQASVQSTSLIMQLPVIVVGRHDYDTYKDAFERLKDTAFEIGVINMDSESDLSTAREVVQKLLLDHPCLPYDSGREWRFLDYVTNAEEGTFRVSRAQEHVNSISDICNPDDCLLILDDAFPSITNRSAGMDANLMYAPPAAVQQPQRTLMQRRISETLRIVLSSDAQETHL
ncbi:diacylglycerol kinase accessory domain protein [Necator americanus]|uniref:Diacylglycerol kinase n=1 Tax=Necator americanus TaxID=51031 RepID=W2T8P1_NECAM|nr:diacylglycerol kinase accessory domain protein [Necator americanus]ETN78238.1 diacylglycerol kinase accessory domain protein [Necator americanus]